MTLVRLVFLPAVLPFQFALLNFCARNRKHLFGEIAKPLERFWVRLAHVSRIRGLIRKLNTAFEGTYRE
jgi:hypothetical protein